MSKDIQPFMEYPGMKNNFCSSLCLLFVAGMIAGFDSGGVAAGRQTNDALDAMGSVTVIYEPFRDKTQHGLAKFQYTWKRNFHYTRSHRTDNGKLLLTINVRANIDHTISHQIFMPSVGKGHTWYTRLLDHEYDHVAISSDQRIFKLLRHLASKFVIKNVQVGSKDKITKKFISARINEQLNKFEDEIEKIVQANYKLLDKISDHGKKPIPDRNRFFSQLYDTENLNRHNFAYIERVTSLLNSKEYTKNNISTDQTEYLTYKIPDNALEKKGPSSSKGSSLEYWLGGQLVARRSFYLNGNIAELVMYKDGKQHGPHTGWYENGAKHFQMYFNRGRQSNISQSWHDNGKIKSEVFFKNGYRHGILKQWNRKGRLLGSCLFDMGTGTARQWYENGNLKRRTGFKNGKLHGIAKQWDKDGRALPNTTKFYLNGKQVDKNEYLKAKKD